MSQKSFKGLECIFPLKSDSWTTVLWFYSGIHLGFFLLSLLWVLYFFDITRIYFLDFFRESYKRFVWNSSSGIAHGNAGFFFSGILSEISPGILLVPVQKVPFRTFKAFVLGSLKGFLQRVSSTFGNHSGIPSVVFYGILPDIAF